MKPSELRPEHVGRTVILRRTWRGKITATDPSAFFVDPGDGETTGFPLHDDDLDVELARPEVPTGLGAVVRLDDEATLVRSMTLVGFPWTLAGTQGPTFSDAHVAARIAHVLSEGVTP